ncbi:hypothetical protein [Paenibacillus dokdonensis]|uniref:hypothetical protein n=1 Tax=Paenibacillus dokdonensis TaxID=2567944 RepID=UPI0010A77473|nr:hypothetical protein [Paenibacillus dokdonensis]
MGKFMAGLGIFCGAALVLFMVILFSGGDPFLVPIVGFSIVIAMLGVVLINQQKELETRKRAEKRHRLNSGIKSKM